MHQRGCIREADGDLLARSKSGPDSVVVVTAIQHLHLATSPAPAPPPLLPSPLPNECPTSFLSAEGTGRTGMYRVPPNSYPFYGDAERYTPVMQADGGQLSGGSTECIATDALGGREGRPRGGGVSTLWRGVPGH